MHKSINKYFYATDGDLCLISKKPPGTVAYLDYKDSGDKVTFSEAIQYNEWMNLAPVYIVVGANPESGQFKISRYLGANWKPEPPTVKYGEVIYTKNWKDFEIWEESLRAEYTKRGGWHSLQPNQS